MANFDRSIGFFTEMAKVLKAAKSRLLVGNAVDMLRLYGGKPPRGSRSSKGNAS
jgi:hypothetical protein